MESRNISDELASLCLGEELTKVVAERLGAVPKATRSSGSRSQTASQTLELSSSLSTSKTKAEPANQTPESSTTSCGSKPSVTFANNSPGQAPSDIYGEGRQHVQKLEKSSSAAMLSSRLQAPVSPALIRKQQKKKNRKDRRKAEEDMADGGQQSRVAKVRSQVQRSKSNVNIQNSMLPVVTETDVTDMLFKSQSSVRRAEEVFLKFYGKLPILELMEMEKRHIREEGDPGINTGIKNLPDSFFDDELQETSDLSRNDSSSSEKKEGKKRRKGRKKKEETKENNKENELSKVDQFAAPEVEVGSEDKASLDSAAKDPTVNGKQLVEDEADADAEQIITTIGDEQTVYNWRNVTKNGDIKKCVLVEGTRDSGRPSQGDVVLVKSQGKLKDGTMIDDYPTLVFRVGEYEVIEGLDLAVQTMHKNELSIISVKPDLAYGQLGRKPDVPSNSRITYLFGLLHFEKQKEVNEMTWAQRRKMGQSRMRIANWWYSRKEYPIAVKCYKKALQFYNNIPTNQECSSADEYRELLTLMEERLRVMRQVANIFKRIANLIQSGQIET